MRLSSASPAFGAMLGLGTLLFALFGNMGGTAPAIYGGGVRLTSGSRNSRFGQARAGDAAGMVG